MRRLELRGQVAVEFLLYTAVFMLMVIISFIVVNHVQQSEIPLQQNTVAKETGASFQNALTLAIKGGRGFSYNYSFPRTVFGLPYRIDFNTAKSQNATILLDWQGTYGNFSYYFDVPFYGYKFEGQTQKNKACLNDAGRVLSSQTCAPWLYFENDGENLTIIQGDS